MLAAIVVRKKAGRRTTVIPMSATRVTRIRLRRIPGSSASLRRWQSVFFRSTRTVLYVLSWPRSRFPLPLRHVSSRTTAATCSPCPGHSPVGRHSVYGLRSRPTLAWVDTSGNPPTNRSLGACAARHAIVIRFEAGEAILQAIPCNPPGRRCAIISSPTQSGGGSKRDCA